MENNEPKEQVLDLSVLEVNKLPELKGLKQQQEQLVKDNPFVAITDNKTYEAAKKARTNLLKGRTGLGGQEKIITSKLNAFKNRIKEATESLVKITKPHEEKQQAEVKRYEEIKAQEKAEKERIEAERKQGIKDNINSIFQEWKTAISNLTYDGIKDFLMLDILADADTTKFEEFELDFSEKVQTLTNLFNEKKQQLEIAEKQKVEAEKLKKEREELERKQKLEDERLKKEREQFEKEQKLAKEKAEKEAENKRKEQEKIDAENKKKADEIAKKEADLQAEKDRLAKIESDRLAKEKAEKKAKAEAERKAKEEKERKAREESERKRLEAIAPDKEKISKFINSMSFSEDVPTVADEKLNEFLNSSINHLNIIKEQILVKLDSLK